MLCSLYARPSGNWERDAMDCFNLSLLSTEHAGEPSWIDGTHSEYDIIVRYQGEYRGLVQYYGLAQNLAQLG